MDKEQLIAFEDSVAEEFNQGNIRYPVHLDNGNEEQLIEIFKDFKEGDAVFGSWRLHYKALLAGVPEQTLMGAIKLGHSMALNLPKYKVWGSAIVGGIVPIALGYAKGVQMQNKTNHTWCFVGDMTYRTGLAKECISYAQNFKLPITFVVEDNGKSVMTDTRKAWGEEQFELFQYSGNVIGFKYESKYPHSGANKRVQF